jgi:adenosylcobinamide-phosphate synthase
MRRCRVPDGMTGRALLAGYVADLAIGDPARFHPVAGFGRAAARAERRWWRPSRAAGVLHAAGLVLGTGAMARRLDRALVGARAARGAVTVAVVWAALGGRSLAREGRAVAALVSAGDLDAARQRIGALVGRDPADLGANELCRAAVESIAENTADAVVAPLLWGSVAGPAGVVAYRAANTLDAMVGHRCPRYERFGWAAAHLDDLLTWPAARVGAALAVALAPLAGGRAREAWRVLRHDGAAHPSPNAGRLEAAFAGALGVRLGGRNSYGGRIEQRPHLGNGRVPGPADVAGAVRLSGLVGGAAALCAAAVGEAVGA